MNEHEISQYSFQQVLERWGHGRSSCAEGDIVLLDEATSSFREEDVNVIFRKSIIVAEVIGIDDTGASVKARRIWRFYEDGADAPETGDVQVPNSVLEKATRDRLRETDGIL